MNSLDGNPFNGGVEVSDAEMLRRWHILVGWTPLVLVWLAVQAVAFGHAWAGWLFEQGVTVWIFVAIVTWKTNVLRFLLTLYLACSSAKTAFIGEFRDAYQS